MQLEIQPYPANGDLAVNLNLTLPKLLKLIGKARQPACSYIVRSVRFDRSDNTFEQRGSAPNFEGGCLTLCTCKHQMRTSRDVSEWQDTWLAGFTSRCIHQKRHWLFYLTRISSAFESHADLWDALPAEVRDAKSAQDHFLGDVFVPREELVEDNRFSPRRYFAPSRHSHRKNKCDSGWHNDINYKHSSRYGWPSLLVGDPEQTYLWQKPMIAFNEHHCRNFKKWDGTSELLSHLERANS